VTVRSVYALVDDLLRQLGVGVREQHLAHAGAVQRQPPAEPRHDVHRLARRQPLDENRFGALQYRQLHVLAQRGVQVVHERECGGAQRDTQRCQGAQLPQLDAHGEPAVRCPVQRPGLDKFQRQSAHCGMGQPGLPGQVGEGEPGPAGPEREENLEQP
jgi:hypothetical protein